ncbi:MAG: hypothetical protein NDJ94_23410, partial [Vicinamibacteria bacterium]|nr:hypothetical protein [Vicinamibacteria bacterium]
MPHILPAPETSWVLAPLAARRSLAGAGVLPAMLAAGPLALAGAWRARSRPASRGGVPGALEFTARPGRVVLARHASGAWSVHLPADGGRRFAVAAPPARRGGAVALDLFVLQAAARAVLPRAARALEQQLWKSSSHRLGLVAVSRAGLRSARLALAPPPSRRPAGRRLLLLHGTFSSTEHAFAGLATLPGADRFWRFVAERYPGGVFGFNHFTLCDDPRANARALLEALGPGAFDAISHSRGGLVLRSLVESLAEARARAGLDLGRAVLAAAPNEGTPLAAPGRRADLVALLVNLAEELTPAALGLGLPFAAAVLAGLARGVAVALPGLAAMQPEGGFLHALNGPPAPPEGAYVALCAHATLAGGRLARFVDAGLGALFAQPHDLVVPTAGGWSVDAVGRPAIGADRIACFGPGGNLAGGAHHFNLFTRAETVDLLVRSLVGEPLGLAVVDPQAPLATTRRASASRT